LFFQDWSGAGKSRKKWLGNSSIIEYLDRKMNDNVGRTAACSTVSSQNKAAASKETFRDAEEKILVLCGTDRLGFGDDELGLKLMINFIRTLKEIGDDDLWRLLFVNNGVKLTVEGSEVFKDLKIYESNGLKKLVCGTCLNHFDLLEKKKVGETTNMVDIVTSMLNHPGFPFSLKCFQ